MSPVFRRIAALCFVTAFGGMPVARGDAGDPSSVFAPASDEVGFLVVHPDRGFLGNEEIRDAFEAFGARRNAELVVATDERTEDNLRAGLDAVARRGARRAVVLPLFLSGADSRVGIIRKSLGAERETKHPADGASPLAVSMARPFGESYLAVEALADRLRTIPQSVGRHVVVAGYGGRDRESGKAMEVDWQRLTTRAAEGMGFASIRALVWPERRTADFQVRQEEARKVLEQAAAAGPVVIVPFHLGRKLDSMMSFQAELKRMVPPGGELLEEDGLPAAASLWLERTARQYVTPQPRDVGIVFLAHGADYHWNETMRQAVASLVEKYKIEFALSMADRPVIERALRRLENRGAQAAVIVRVFGLSSSFREDVERMVGLDLENGRGIPIDPVAFHHHAERQHGHHGDAGAPPHRIRSALPIVSVGGIEDHPLFAAALLDRAKELSRNPVEDTVILTAHGSGNDGENERWLQILGSLAQQMRANGGSAFRAIRFATWREDWPDKRSPWVAKIRQMVEEASREGGRAIVVPARTNGRGPEAELLAGLPVVLGTGFAPHPLFTRWFEEQIRVGTERLAAGLPSYSASGVVDSKPAVLRAPHEGH